MTDASGSVDHLAELLAVPLQETWLSSFPSGREARTEDMALDARLSGRITDFINRVQPAQPDR